MYFSHQDRLIKTNSQKFIGQIDTALKANKKMYNRIFRITYVHNDFVQQ